MIFVFKLLDSPVAGRIQCPEEKLEKFRLQILQMQTLVEALLNQYSSRHRIIILIHKLIVGIISFSSNEEHYKLFFPLFQFIKSMPSSQVWFGSKVSSVVGLDTQAGNLL